jgi:hypothetical protein
MFRNYAKYTRIGTVAGCRLVEGVRFLTGDFFPLLSVLTVSGNHSHSCIMSVWDLSQWAKRQSCDVHLLSRSRKTELYLHNSLVFTSQHDTTAHQLSVCVLPNTLHVFTSQHDTTAHQLSVYVLPNSLHVFTSQHDTTAHQLSVCVLPNSHVFTSQLDTTAHQLSVCVLPNSLHVFTSQLDTTAHQLNVCVLPNSLHVFISQLDTTAHQLSA